MIVAGSASPLLLSSAGGYNLTNSLRFRSSASAYLNRTFGTPTDNKKFTWSGWVKRGTLGAFQMLQCGDDGTSDNFLSFRFSDTDTLQCFQSSGGSYNLQVSTSAVFRDPSAWYHIVFIYDSANATSTNRIQFYVNGVLQTVSYAVGPFAINTASQLNVASRPNAIGRLLYASVNYFDGYMTEVNFIDGQALTPSSFGQTSSTTGVWIPKKYTGTYGTNGFYLPFTNTASTSTLGNDFSGNSNTWTVNNISLTAGSTYDSMTDVPTLTSATTANYGVINPLSNGNQSVTAGNLNISNASSAWYSNISTIGVSSGKWYFEATVPTYWQYGHIGVLSVAQTPLSQYVGYYPAGWAYQTDGRYWNNNVDQTGKTVTSSGDVLMVAFDMDNSKIWFGKNGTWFDSGNPATGANAIYSNLSGTLSPAFSVYASSSGFQSNFGQRPFTYTPPTGFNRLNTFNLPTPTIGATASTTANEYFDTTLYTGNGTSQSIVNSGSMQPDLVWEKRRDAAQTFSNGIIDSVRGRAYSLVTNLTIADQTSTSTNDLTSFNSNGFSIGPSNNLSINDNGGTYVAWQWRASGSTVSNTAGSITSTVSANTTAGFSIVTYTGTGANATVGHGLGVAPRMIFGKNRTSGTPGWPVYHASVGNTGALILNSTTATDVNSAYWNNTSPTSSVFSIGTGTSVNTSTQNYVMYCFAEVAGYSAFGSYTGNGSADGPFVYTGFRPRFIMIKASSAARGWIMFDTARDPYNVSQYRLFANTSDAESSGTTANNMDILSNGFKLRLGSNSEPSNENGTTYIYMAFAENPFKYSLAR
jgi:hypothetical protein